MFDVVLAIATGISAAVVYLDYDQREIALYITAISLTSLLSSLLRGDGPVQHRARSQPPLRHIPSLLVIWTITIALLQSESSLSELGDMLSRVWLASWYLSGGLVLVGRGGSCPAVRAWTKSGTIDPAAPSCMRNKLHAFSFLDELEGERYERKSRRRRCFDDRSRDRTTANPPRAAARSRIASISPGAMGSILRSWAAAQQRKAVAGGRQLSLGAAG